MVIVTVSWLVKPQPVIGVTMAVTPTSFCTGENSYAPGSGFAPRVAPVISVVTAGIAWPMLLITGFNGVKLPVAAFTKSGSADTLFWSQALLFAAFQFANVVKSVFWKLPI